MAGSYAASAKLLFAVTKLDPFYEGAHLGMQPGTDMTLSKPVRPHWRTIIETPRRSGVIPPAPADLDTIALPAGDSEANDRAPRARVEAFRR